jgi:hypothetical protein
VEQLLDEFVQKCGDRAPAAFAARFPHPFFLRELQTGQATRKLTKEEIDAQAERIRRMSVRGTYYVLSQYGAGSVESLLRDVTVAGTTQMETHVIALAATRAWPVSFGSAADVSIPNLEPIELYVAPGADETFTITPKVELWYDDQPSVPGEPFTIEDGLLLQLTAETAFQTFTPTGLAHLLAFRTSLLAAKAKAPPA